MLRDRKLINDVVVVDRDGATTTMMILFDEDDADEGSAMDRR